MIPRVFQEVSQLHLYEAFIYNLFIFYKAIRWFYNPFKTHESTQTLPSYSFKKYKIFFVDAVLVDTGEIITAYTKNKGGFSKEMAKDKCIYVSHHLEPHRKTKYSVELIDNNGLLSGVDPDLGFKLLSEYLEGHKDLKLIKKR